MLYCNGTQMLFQINLIDISHGSIHMSTEYNHQISCPIYLLHTQKKSKILIFVNAHYTESSKCLRKIDQHSACGITSLLCFCSEATAFIRMYYYSCSY